MHELGEWAGQLRDDRRKLAELRTVRRVPEEFANLDGSTNIVARLIVENSSSLNVECRAFLPSPNSLQGLLIL